MNSRILLALPLAAALSLSALAQTTSSTQDQNQPAATSQSNSTQSTPNENATGKQPLQPPSREGFWGHLNPFARKSYVKRQTEPIRDRVNELDDLTAANGKAIKDTDSRAQAGIKLASDKANEADQHAVDAGNKATMANRQHSKPHSGCRPSRLWSATSISIKPRTRLKSASGPVRPC